MTILRFLNKLYKRYFRGGFCIFRQKPEPKPKILGTDFVFLGTHFVSPLHFYKVHVLSITHRNVGICLWCKYYVVVIAIMWKCSAWSLTWLGEKPIIWINAEIWYVFGFIISSILFCHQISMRYTLYCNTLIQLHCCCAAAGFCFVCGKCSPNGSFNNWTISIPCAWILSVYFPYLWYVIAC